MAQKRIKRTDQEWFDLIKDCKTSSLKVKIWCEQQEIVCLDISKSLFSGQEETTSTDPWAANAAVLHLDFQGTPIGISNHAAKETIENTLLALRSLC